MTLLTVKNLHTHFVARDSLDRIRTAKALNGVSFSVEQGEIIGLVGETGAGKSLTALSVLGLLKPPARVVEGSALFEGRDLLVLPPAALNKLRGRDIALVVQSPKTSLDPLTRIGDQIVRVQLAHGCRDRQHARAKALELLTTVGIPDPERRMQAYPHQLSGGMAQRVLIALSLANDPKLLIADEPTTGLDVTVQAQILDLVRELVRSRGLGVVIITHDLGVVAQYCDQVCVMFAGTIVEEGPVGEVLVAPVHPYTRALIAATPEGFALGEARVTAGPPPNLYALPPGCVYSDRCPRADGLCETPPPVITPAPDHRARCHHPVLVKSPQGLTGGGSLAAAPKIAPGGAL
jgi:peptide/nickel transport system ATP-binding protein/oligopeptide transport system ATP-binding protein